MILAIEPQRLSPALDRFAFMHQRIGDRDCLAGRRFEQGKRREQIEGRFFQFRIEGGQRGIFPNQIPENPDRVAQTGEDLWRE